MSFGKRKPYWYLMWGGGISFVVAVGINGGPIMSLFLGGLLAMAAGLIMYVARND
jgi:hypothetical protein